MKDTESCAAPGGHARTASTQRRVFEEIDLLLAEAMEEMGYGGSDLAASLPNDLLMGPASDADANGAGGGFAPREARRLDRQ